jgi:restriction endonuclease S subunit/very-short-patch-repair endonuclease
MISNELAQEKLGTGRLQMSKLNEMLKGLKVAPFRLDALLTCGPKSKLGVGKVKELQDSNPGDVICFTSGSATFSLSLVHGENIYVNDGGKADFKYFDGDAAYTDHVISYTSKSEYISTKFIYYTLKEKQHFIQETLFKGAGVQNISRKGFESLEVLMPLRLATAEETAKIENARNPELNTESPLIWIDDETGDIFVPDIEVQSEIVKVLDNFTELEARKKQYEYYRNQLLTFPSLEGWREATGWFSSREGETACDGVVQEVSGSANTMTRTTSKWMSLPYNPKLKERARELRKAGNLSEVLLWQQIKSKKLNGLDFDRQKIIGNYIVDFFCASNGVVIEVDGESHNDSKFEYDKKRNEFLESLELTVIHILDIDVKQNLEGVVKMLLSHPALNHPVASRHPSTEENHPVASRHPSKEGNLPSMAVEWKTLGEVAMLKAGGDLPANYVKGQNLPSPDMPYPIYSNGSGRSALYGYTNEYRIADDAITISARGTIGYHTVRLGKFTPIVRLITVIPNNKVILIKFLNYALDTTEIGHSGGSIPQLTVPNVKKLKIPIPSLAEQQRIVDILDKFDALTTDISAGLPAEIKARHQQYEYYRNKLLSFEGVNNG